MTYTAETVTALAEELADAMRYCGRAEAFTETGERIEARTFDDHHARLTDYDYFGELAERREYRTRPHTFDGNAEIVFRDRGSRIWWQPPADVKRGTPEFTRLRSHVRGWLDGSWSYIGITVTVSRPCDKCGSYEEIGSASLAGVESESDADYYAEVIAELIYAAAN